MPTINYTAPKNSTVSVYQSWGLDETVGHRLQFASTAAAYRAAYRGACLAAYAGSLDLQRDAQLEELFVLLQNDSHADGWVEATGAQDGWPVKVLGCSLSTGDLLEITTGSSSRRFAVLTTGFLEI
tara:strand:+ start:36123 stop:36500 length:378 start_codon:yes stop_codon:yes gene_type:complete